MTNDPEIFIDDFEQVVFFTGAGMSVESGIPTYRGAGGVWKQYNYEEYACQDAFEHDPEKVWEFHNARRELISRCQPNAGHELIARLQGERDGFTIITQNIDGLHQRAGARQVHELHGSLWRVRCDACGVVEPNVDVPFRSLRHDCGGWWRPDIVWFGDALPSDVLEASIDVVRSCGLLVSVGTSGVVFPAAQLPIMAKQSGATLVEVNLERSQFSDLFDHCLRGPATEVLPRLTHH